MLLHSEGSLLIFPDSRSLARRPTRCVSQSGEGVLRMLEFCWRIEKLAKELAKLATEQKRGGWMEKRSCLVS